LQPLLHYFPWEQACQALAKGFVAIRRKQTKSARSGHEELEWRSHLRQ